MKIIVAGGSGFLGRALSEHLVGRGHDVVVLTRSGSVGAAACVDADGARDRSAGR